MATSTTGFHSDRRICFVVGDVRGKGVGAVEQAARVIRAFRQYAAADADVATMAAEMSAYLMPFFDDEEFTTAVLVQITDNTRLTLVNCGHPSPILVPRGGEATFVEPPVCLPLGLGSSYESLSMPWTPGDRLLLYTDGLSEARDERGEYMPSCRSRRCSRLPASKTRSMGYWPGCAGTCRTGGSSTTWPCSCWRTASRKGVQTAPGSLVASVDPDRFVFVARGQPSDVPRRHTTHSSAASPRGAGGDARPARHTRTGLHYAGRCMARADRSEVCSKGSSHAPPS